MGFHGHIEPIFSIFGGATVLRGDTLPSPLPRSMPIGGINAARGRFGAHHCGRGTVGSHGGIWLIYG